MRAYIVQDFTSISLSGDIAKLFFPLNQVELPVNEQLNILLKNICVTTFGKFCPIQKACQARQDCVFERGQTMRWRSAADERRTPAERGVPDL